MTVNIQERFLFEYVSARKPVHLENEHSTLIAYWYMGQCAIIYENHHDRRGFKLYEVDTTQEALLVMRLLGYPRLTLVEPYS